MGLPDNLWVGVFEEYRRALKDSTEAPDSYHYASILTVVSALMGRMYGVYAGRDVYPNQFSLLIGPTNLKKTTAMRAALGLLPDEWTMNGISSAEGLITVLQRRNGKPLIIVQEEFTHLLGKARQEHTANLLPRLNELYDFPRTIEVPTRKEPLLAQNPCASLLAGTTPEWFAESVRPTDLMGGFSNRFCYYVELQSKAPKARTTPPDLRPAQRLVAKLLNRLTDKPEPRRLVFSEDGGQIWDRWYEKTHALLAAEPSEVLRLTLQRMPEHAQKVALVYAVLDGAKELRLEDVERGIAFAEYQHEQIILLFREITLAQDAAIEAKIQAVLADAGGKMTRRELHQRLGGRLRADSLARVLTGLQALGILRLIPGEGKEIELVGSIQAESRDAMS